MAMGYRPTTEGRSGRQIKSPGRSEAVKVRTLGDWSAGDYAAIGNTLQIVGEMLCEAVDLRSNQRVLDVAAERRFADAVWTADVDSRLEHGAKRAAADRLPVTFQQADAECLPFPAESFDVVLSTFGAMFTPDQARAARELVRVCRRGGKIGLANWTPEECIGRLFRIVCRYVPPVPGVNSPLRWGTKRHLETRFGSDAVVVVKNAHFIFRYRSQSPPRAGTGCSRLRVAAWARVLGRRYRGMRHSERYR